MLDMFDEENPLYMMADSGAVVLRPSCVSSAACVA